MTKSGPTELIYSEAEDAIIEAGAAMNMNAEQIAKRLPGRSPTSVYEHARKVLDIDLRVIADVPRVGYTIPKTGHLGVRAKDDETRARSQAPGGTTAARGSVAAAVSLLLGWALYVTMGKHSTFSRISRSSAPPERMC